MLSADRNRILYRGWVLEPITAEALLLKFDCGNEDLNSFYENDLWHHEEELITKSYIFPQKALPSKKQNLPQLL